MAERPIFVNYGGGSNSTALLVEAARRGLRPDVVIMADTGSEMPHTYEYMDVFDRWLRRELGIPLTVVRWIRKRAPHEGKFIALHEWCEDRSTMPSKSFGLSGCTVKWKQQPVDAAVEEHPMTQGQLAAGDYVERWLGYDADEPQRFNRVMDKERHALQAASSSGQVVPWRWRAPLIEWDMGREECIAAIKGAGLLIEKPNGELLPGKSACFMCPSTTKAELRNLRVRYPKLYQDALAMEQRCDDAGNMRTVNGLGQRLSWRAYDVELQLQQQLPPSEVARLTELRNKLLGYAHDQLSIFHAMPDAPAMECGCWDGDATSPAQ